VFDTLARVEPAARLDRLVARGVAVPGGAPALPVPSELAALVPEGGLRRGTVVGFDAPSGSTSLLLATVVPAVREGSWLAVVGLPGLGAETAAGLGLPLDRLVLVPDPGGRAAEVAAALVDAVDVVVMGARQGLRPGQARRLAARVQERHGLLIVAGAGWPEPVHLRLELADPVWSELDQGDGMLAQREVTVRVTGRRAAIRPRAARVLLPGPDGRLRTVAPPVGGIETGVEVRDKVGTGIGVKVVEPPLRALAG
jgi:hypothetical protein